MEPVDKSFRLNRAMNAVAFNSSWAESLFPSGHNKLQQSGNNSIGTAVCVYVLIFGVIVNEGRW
ncbi:unnamed protein product [Protopolystoma xenopodis]|uniref:Uncharacterized protein n=1 Tax=Protopolystoma xenopodis TaxID=117903 RepID=A0A3S5BT65_9PLAT|nr:unnamed protein product [Protopolystoma xenopodis]